MGTRSVFTFSDARNTFHVYKHFDGYPSGAFDAVEKAKNYAFGNGRFEACEFAAAFVAANKDGSGGIYLSNGPDDHGDLDYRYTITMGKTGINIAAYSCDGDKSEMIFDGVFFDFEVFAKEYEDTI